MIGIVDFCPVTQDMILKIYKSILTTTNYSTLKIYLISAAFVVNIRVGDVFSLPRAFKTSSQVYV